ncbi:MAG: UDP-N-acetylmuramoyl-tripeptide--D-alanyl-D-alanine ligase [Bacilli bacterium]|nr:UDP-N-acetylmuramoyl-tripeptide--D-alanyl-D-alanine ligase [Bacilli bacterium]
MNNLLISLIPFILYMILKYRKAIYMLQQNSYNVSNRYIKWVFKNPFKTLITYDLSLFPLLLIILILKDYYIYVAFLLFSLCFYIELKLIKKEQQKKPFVITSRVKRLFVTLFILFLTLIYFIYRNYNDEYILYYYLIIALFGYLSFIITYIINIINIPAEKFVYLYYLNKAKKKLKNMPNLEIVGITGSYGKTSSKNILNTILSSEYNSYPTPKSFNTPYGLMKSINNGLDKFDNVFIAEMGACKLKDIKILCNLAKPKYGIITTIGVAHLETFKSEENIVKGKFELIETLPSDGVAILNRDDSKQVNYKIKNTCKIIWIGIENKADVMASNLKLSHTGTTFKVKFKNDDKLYDFETKLLGRHNIYNILDALALGYELNIPIPKMQAAVKSLMPIEHRLELKKYKDMYLIDDAFNSNPTGSKMALEVLNLMPGKKIIVTPGMIELGSSQYELNNKFGEYIADVCDDVILVGEQQTKPIYDGLILKKYDKKHIYILNDVKEAFVLIEKLKGEETFVLLENDLPDLFNEGG